MRLGEVHRATAAPRRFAPLMSNRFSHKLAPKEPMHPVFYHVLPSHSCLLKMKRPPILLVLGDRYREAQAAQSPRLELRSGAGVTVLD